MTISRRRERHLINLSSLVMFEEELGIYVYSSFLFNSSRLTMTYSRGFYSSTIISRSALDIARFHGVNNDLFILVSISFIENLSR